MSEDETIISTSDEELVLDVSGAPYLRFPKKFKESFDIKTAQPIQATLRSNKALTILSFVFHNDTLRTKSK